MIEEIQIPDIGDVEHVEVIELCAEPGDEVGVDDALIVIESDKASMEVPAGLAGKVVALTVALGDEVTTGQVIARIETGNPVAVGEPASTDATPSTVDPGEISTIPSAAASRPDDSMKSVADVDPVTRGVEIEVRMPDIGEAKDVVVIEVAVTAGDTVGADDLLVVVESDKASMEIPAGNAGSIVAVHVAVGEEVVEDILLVTLRTEGDSGTPPVPAPIPEAPVQATVPVGRSSADDRAEPAPAAVGRDPATDLVADRRGEVYAGPAVRRLARELGVDLTQVNGSGGRGRIVKDDVKAFVKTSLTANVGSPQTGSGTGIPRIPEVDFSKFGPIEITPLSRIRIAGALNLHRSWLNVPHVTQQEDADVTELEKFRRTLKDDAQKRQVKITPLAFIIKACCYALEAHPTFNASLDAEVKNFILKKYYHIGFAVDTQEGLVVPVIRDADKMGIWELSQAIAELAEKARQGKLAMNDMGGGTFSISSLGAIGGTGFTPLINAPEVAILGVARLAYKPVWDGNEFVPRNILPLSLSYDHRAINGAEAGRFIATLAELLGDIRRLSL